MKPPTAIVATMNNRTASAAHRQPGPGAVRGVPTQAERQPQDRRIDSQSQSEMRDEAVLADLDPIGQPALDHVPAEGSLGEAEQQNAAERRNHPPRQPPAHQKPDKGRGKDDADQPSQQPMTILPEVNAFELIQRHSKMDRTVFWDLFVFGKFGGPVGSGERRHDADNRLPFGDRQARQGEPRDAADYDHQENHCAADEQPDRDRPQSAPGDPLCLPRNPRVKPGEGSSRVAARRTLPGARHEGGCSGGEEGGG